MNIWGSPGEGYAGKSDEFKTFAAFFEAVRYDLPEDRERFKDELFLPGYVRDDEIELRQRDGGKIWVTTNSGHHPS